jgi:ATP-dependent Clp protease ATP-binding subunit ClpA
MSMLSKNLEKSLHRAFALAGERRHEYATLEHLLLAMTEDDDATPVLKACGVDIDRLRHDLETFVDNRLKGIVTQTPSEPLPTAGFQRVVQRAAVHVQSSGRKEVTGANVLVALFSERDSHAVSFLENQGMSRLDAVDYISHGKAKVPGRSRARRVTGSEEENGQRGAGRVLRRPQPESPRRPRRPSDWSRARGRAHHPGAVPAHQEQSALCW